MTEREKMLAGHGERVFSQPHDRRPRHVVRIRDVDPAEW